jgi:hypothetical protein
MKELAPPYTRRIPLRTLTRLASYSMLQYPQYPLTQELAVEWVVLTVLAVAVLVFVIAKLSKGTRPLATWRSSRLSATELLSRVHALQSANAQWDAIWSELNPNTIQRSTNS